MMSGQQWLIVGDTHGQDEIIQIDQWCARNNIHTVIQVGDFGINWPGKACSIYKYFRKRQERNKANVNWYTCGGNHENYTRLQHLRNRGRTTGSLVIYAEGVYYVERGSVIHLDGHPVMFLGGAVSSDAYTRVPNQIWINEAPTLEDCRYALDQVGKHKPEIWVTHDIRSGAVPYYRGGNINSFTGLPTDDTSIKLEGIYNVANTKPRTWFHGHYHRHYQSKVDKTNIVGCGIAHPHDIPANSGWLFNPGTHELQVWNEV
jgi:hypothetical protein